LLELYEWQTEGHEHQVCAQANLGVKDPLDQPHQQGVLQEPDDLMPDMIQTVMAAQGEATKY
jgi:hypothetical protein